MIRVVGLSVENGLSSTSTLLFVRTLRRVDLPEFV